MSTKMLRFTSFQLFLKNFCGHFLATLHLCFHNLLTQAFKGCTIFTALLILHGYYTLPHFYYYYYCLIIVHKCVIPPQIRLLCKQLDFRGHGPLQLFCPNFVNPTTHSYSLRSMNTDSLLLSSTIQFNSLDLFRRSFFGAIIDIWAATPVELRRRGVDQGWSTVVKLLQKCVCEL